jgi:hypothetical protein
MAAFDEPALIAPCGMNCGICMAYLRDKSKCPGCRRDDSAKPVTRARCKIKNCPEIQKSQTGYCFDCVGFPCPNLKHLDKRYRAKYNMSMVENLAYIKQFGINGFLENETERWTCPECGGTICVHKGYCSRCGHKR